MKIRPLTILVAVFMVTLVASPALAYYHPGMGRFLQRDPNGMQVGPTAPRAIGGPAAHGGFVQRDFNPHQQYADGMNLYQYVRSSPTRYVDPTGTTSITFNREPGYYNKRIRGAAGQAIVTAHAEFTCVRCENQTNPSRCWMISDVSVTIRAIILIDETAFEGGRKPHGQSLPEVFGHEEQHINIYERYYNHIADGLQTRVDRSSLATVVGRCIFTSKETCERAGSTRSRSLERILQEAYRSGFTRAGRHREDPNAPEDAPGRHEGFLPVGDVDNVGQWPGDSPGGLPIIAVQ